jgi:tetratricopeptide (TPR) repeat protein
MNWPQETARHLGELGRALLKSNRYAEAQSAIEEALEIQDRIKENRSIRFLGNLVTLACIHELLGNKNEIVPLVSRAIALRQELAFNSARAHGQNKIDLEHLKRFEEIQCIPKE